MRDLRGRGLLAGHLTAGPAYGGEGEAISTAGAIHHGLHDLGWEAVACGPGPGILGSASALGHGGMAVLDSAHVALALGCPTLVVARMSAADSRERHRGLSHHTSTVLELLLGSVTVAIPPGADDRAAGAPHPGGGRRRPRRLPRKRPAGAHHGPRARQDPDFFAAALAAGSALAGMIEA